MTGWLGILISLIVLFVVMYVISLLADMAIARFGFPAETKPIAIALAFLIGIIGIFSGYRIHM